MYMPKSAKPYTPSSAQPVDSGGFLSKIANSLPIFGGIAGGVTGAMAGGTAGSIIPGAGTAAGGIYGGGLGTTIGTAAGGATKNMILDLAGKQEKQPLKQVAEVGKEAALAGVLDTATAGALHGGGKILGTLGRGISKVVEDIPLKSIRFKPSQITKWASKHGQDLSGWMVEKKILGENAIDIAEKSVAELQDKFDNLAMNENITIPFSKLEKRFVKEIADLGGGTVKGVKTKIVPAFNKGVAKKILDEWSNVLKQAEQMNIKDLTPKMLTELRRMVDDVIPESAFVDPSVKNIAMRTRNILNDVVREGVDERLIGKGTANSLKTIGAELSKYYDFLKYAEKQSGLGRGSLLANPTRLLSILGGGGIGMGAGGPGGAMLGAGLGLGAETAMRDPSVLKKIYQGGQVAKKALPKIGEKLNPLIRAITSGGATTAATKLVK